MVYPVFQRYALCLDTALDELLRQPATEAGFRNRAVARNLMHDHRVGSAREPAFQDCTALRPALREALQRYYDTHVRAPYPDFLDDALNLNNFVAGARVAVDKMDPNTPLLRVINLSRERAAFQWAYYEWSDRRKDRFRQIVNAGAADDRHQAIGEQLAGNAEAFLDAWFDMSSARRKSLRAPGANKPDGPVWAVLAKEFRREMNLRDEANPRDDDAARWFEAVGVDPVDWPVWAILVEYPLWQAGTLVRPTFLDSGGYPLHFPSPPAAPLSAGGLVMNLQADPLPAVLRSEFIHQTIDFQLPHWTAAGQHYAATRRPVAAGIQRQRRAHYKLLSQVYNGVSQWMPQYV
jgi:hypothetical protein